MMSRNKIYSRLPRWALPLYILAHPAMIIPLAVVVAGYFGRYSPAQITQLQEVPLFLQGSTDMGGSDLFSGTVALYVSFGLLGSIYLVLRLTARLTNYSYASDLVFSLWALKFHIVAFVIGGTMFWGYGYDSRITPNDFRNIFFLATFVYFLTILFIPALIRIHLPLILKLILAPLIIYLWLFMGWDGNTAKAGQVLLSGQNPAISPRGIRHKVMLSWHQLCDNILGDQ